MLLLQSLLLLAPLWSICALASAIPLPVRDLLSEQKAIAAEQSQLSAPSSTIDITSVPSQSPQPEHKNPIRNGDPYGLTDFGIDPAHVTSEQMQALREAGMIRELDDDESSAEWLLSYVNSWPLLKMCLLGTTAIAVIKAILHFKHR